jgi:alpha/beta superfamily hydrolase
MAPAPARSLAIVPAEGPRLAGLLDGPEDAGRGVVICHPHPAFGGRKESTVVRLVAEACSAAGLLALRFDFRGVGASAGESTAGPAEWDDVAAALDTLAGLLPPEAPLGLAGYSFGAWAAAQQAARDDRAGALALIAPVRTVGRMEVPHGALRGRPVLAVVAEHDHLTGPQEAGRMLEEIGGGRIEVVTGADHYLHGYAEDAAAIVAAFLDAALPASRGGAVRPEGRL